MLVLSAFLGHASEVEGLVRVDGKEIDIGVGDYPVTVFLCEVGLYNTVVAASCSRRSDGEMADVRHR